MMVLLSSGYNEEFDESSEMVVPDNGHWLYAVDILDPSLARSNNLIN